MSVSKIAELRKERIACVQKLGELVKTADDESRSITDEEKQEFDRTELRAIELADDIERRERAERLQPSASLNDTARPEERDQDAPEKEKAETRSPGRQFVESAQYRSMQTAGQFKTEGFSMPSVEVRTTLTEAAGGNDLTAFSPMILPGIIPLRFKRLMVADLMPSGTADGNLIRYMKELAFTNAAATVAELGTKPESAITFTHVDETFRKIAHTLPVSEEMLEDVSAIRSFIDARLVLGVQLTEEDQLLNGDGTGSNLVGLLNRANLNTATARGTDTNADATFKQVTSIFTNAFYNVDGIVMNPANWQTIQLAKNAQGDYYGSGPWIGAQGGIFGNGGPYLWGTRVVVTPSIAAGTALVGAFGEAAQVFRKGGIQLAATNSHASEFINNITRIRAEERLALAVYRPGAFGTVTGLN